MMRFLSKEELLSIQRGLEDIKNGRTYRMQEGESLTDFLKRTEECIKIEFSEEATKELLKLMKSDVQAYKKFESLIPNFGNTHTLELGILTSFDT